MYIFLSHKIEKGEPGWPGTPDSCVTPMAQMSEGASCNTYILSLFNHRGTHMDAPNHYLEDGAKIGDLPPERFVFERPLLLDIPKGEMEKIKREDLQPHAKVIAGSDALLLRTGFSQKRETDPESYMRRGPAVSAEAAEYLVQNFPGLKTIVLDFLSLACTADTEDGDKAHRWLLGAHTGHFTAIVEDADLHGLIRPPLRIFALPIRMEAVDSAPVTLLAELAENAIAPDEKIV